jgi:hypothetical protein
MYGAALSQYGHAAPVLRKAEQESACLRSALCQERLGQPGKAVEILDTLDPGSCSEAARRQALRMRFGLALQAGDGRGLERSFEAIHGDARLLAERASVLEVLCRADRLWERRALWEGPLFDRIFEAASFWREAWAARRPARGLLRFLRLARGPESILVRLPVLESRARGPWAAPGAEVLRRIHADARTLLPSAKAGSPPASRVLFELESQGPFPARATLDRLWDLEPAQLRTCLMEALARAERLDDAFRFRRYGDYAWGRGNLGLARELYRTVLDRFGGHGSQACGCLLGLASMALWAGDLKEAAAEAQRLCVEYPAEAWAVPFGHLLSGRMDPATFLTNEDQAGLWLQDPPPVISFLALAAVERSRGRPAETLRSLEMVQSLSFPWEPAFDVARVWMADLAPGRRA